jgi:hypothetical protein
MTTRAERNVGIGSIAAGLGAVVFGLVSGMTTAEGSLDWVGVITVGAGLALVITGMLDLFRHGTD